MNFLKAFARKLVTRLDAVFGRGLVVMIGLILLLGVVVGAVGYGFLNTAAPRTLTISSGPPGSSFQRYAERYQKILAREGVTLEILPSEGSSDNLARLTDRKSKVDVGFVLSGETKEVVHDDLFSLGGVASQPLLVFYVGKPRRLLSEFKGGHLNIGPDGSGTHRLALQLLKANGIVPGQDTKLDETDLDDPSEALHQRRVDAVFVMSDSTASTVARKLMRDESVRLFNFLQADAYVRRINTLSKLLLPRGALDFGEDIPPEDLHLIGPTVHLIARESLHPALSDVLLEAAREVHGTAGLFRKRGEFPTAQEGEFKVSPDATRYYASGKGFLYRTFPFWLASLIARVLAVLVPLVILLIPALRLAPRIYRWRIESRIYRWYRALLELEREAMKAAPGPERRQQLLLELDGIESAVNRVVVPASFGDLFYGLRGHIGLVRSNLLAGPLRSSAEASPEDSPSPL